jgi:TolB-like protein
MGVRSSNLFGRVAEGIINALSRFKAFAVIARNSSFVSRSA